MHNILTRLSTTPINWVTSAFSPAGRRGRLSIVLYHKIPAESDELLNDQENAKTFAAQIHYLSNHFKILPLHEAIQRLQDGTLPSRAACITFDDGYADNVEVALPILQKYGAPATFFIAAGFINGGLMWNDTIIELIRRAPGHFLDLDEIGLGKHEIHTLEQRRKILFALIARFKYLPVTEKYAQLEKLCHLIPVVPPENMMMTADQIRQLHHAGMEIGGHTVSHPILACMDDKSAYDEIANGKNILEQIIQAPVRFFAYPNGKPRQDYLPGHVAMLKEIGFEAAVSTAWGAADNATDIYQLPRFTPWDTSRIRFVTRMILNLQKRVDTVA